MMKKRKGTKRIIHTKYSIVMRCISVLLTIAGYVIMTWFDIWIINIPLDGILMALGLCFWELSNH